MRFSRLKWLPQSVWAAVLMAVQLSMLTLAASTAWADLPTTVAKIKPSIVAVGTFMVFQLDAVAYPGNSGSPLYDVETGRVIGVINSVYVKKTKETAISSPSGITYAVPVDYVRALLKKAGVGP